MAVLYRQAFVVNRRTPLIVLAAGMKDMPLVNMGTCEDVREEVFDLDADLWRKAGVPGFHAGPNLTGEPYSYWF